MNGLSLMLNSDIKKKLSIIFLFSTAMGFLEAIIVVYLRELYYPLGFNFPIESIPDSILAAEFVREFCTLIMLVSLAWLAGKNKLEVFSYFLYSFAVWDIFYYIALKVFLDWPESLLTWDILFLIPVTWISPVLAPLICSFTMIILALVLLYTNYNIELKINSIEWVLIWLGAIIIFITFIWEFKELNNPEFIPYSFHWEIFSSGILLVYISIYLILKRSSKLPIIKK